MLGGAGGLGRRFGRFLFFDQSTQGERQARFENVCSGSATMLSSALLLVVWLINSHGFVVVCKKQEASCWR